MSPSSFAFSMLSRSFKAAARLRAPGINARNLRAFTAPSQPRFSEKNTQQEQSQKDSEVGKKEAKTNVRPGTIINRKREIEQARIPAAIQRHGAREGVNDLSDCVS